MKEKHIKLLASLFKIEKSYIAAGDKEPLYNKQKRNVDKLADYIEELEAEYLPVLNAQVYEAYSLYIEAKKEKEEMSAELVKMEADFFNALNDARSIHKDEPEAKSFVKAYDDCESLYKEFKANLFQETIQEFNQTYQLLLKNYKKYMEAQNNKNSFWARTISWFSGK